MSRPRHAAHAAASGGLFGSPVARLGVLSAVVVLAGGAVLGVYITSGSGSSTPPRSSHGAGATDTTLPGASGSSGDSGGSGNSGTAGATGAATGIFGSIAAKLQAGESQSFAAVYSASSAGSTQTVEYAAKPPSNFLFRSSEPGGSIYELIGTPATTYACRQAKPSAQWTCLDTGAASSTYDTYTRTYTGAYWYKQMESLEVAATVAGVHYQTSTMQLAGQSLQCISYAPGGSAGGQVCVTSRGVLGYVHDNSDGAMFRLTSYSSAVAASLFQLPAGAAVSGTS